MRKTLFAALIALALLLAPCAALGAEGTPLPESVAALIAERFPSGSFEAYDGFGSEARGRFAVAVREGGKYTLAIADRGEGDAAYALLVCPDALRDGEAPRLSIDTGDGDALWIGYGGQEEGGEYAASDSYGFIRDGGGVWRFSGLNHYDSHEMDAERVVNYWASLTDGALRYERFVEDGNENILESQTLAPVPASEAYLGRMDSLETFDIRALPASPENIVRFAEIPGGEGLLAGALGEGETALEMAVREGRLILLVRAADRQKRLRVAEWDGAGYAARETGALPESVGLLACEGVSGDRFAIRIDEEHWEDAYFRRTEDGLWRLTQHYGWLLVTDVFGVGSDEATLLYRNDGFVYGDAPWADLFTADFSALPGTFKEAVAGMDLSGWALVNNPDPADRLHLRTAPDKGAASLGKFYNRTPVYRLGETGEWTHVRIGAGGNALEGYMMTKYLTFEQDLLDGGLDAAALAVSVPCAFPQKHLVGEGESIPMLAAPWEGAARVGEFGYGMGEYIIGVAGDEWFVLMNADGVVGYARQELFWDGNG